MKQIVGTDIGTYAFDKVLKTITFTSITPTLEQIQLITDVTNNTIIYQFNDATKGGTISGSVLTLAYATNTASFANTDKLQIVVDLATRTSPTYPTNSAGVEQVTATGYGVTNNTTQRVAIAGSGTTSSVVTSVANATTAGGYTLFAINTTRISASIYNDDTAASLYVKFGSTPSATSFTIKIAPGGYYEIPFPMYTGIITGIATAATGNARLTEVG